MKEEIVIEICKEVLTRLSKMGYERTNKRSTEQLIFPNKFPSNEKIKTFSEKELLKYVRRSEQELRQLFIDVFKEKEPELFYSIETPTETKYSFGKSYLDIKVCEDVVKGQSALLDMCVFKRDDVIEKYTRILNIEFKYGNAPIKDIAKDVLKLMREKQNGAFIFLFDNTNSGSLNNKGEKRKGVLDKLSQSFQEFQKIENIWNEEKYIHTIILSLEHKTNTIITPTLIYKKLVKDNLKDLNAFFSINANRSGNIGTVCKNSGWQTEKVKERVG